MEKKNLNDFILSLNQAGKVLGCCCFGSFVSDSLQQGSDIDILLVVEDDFELEDFPSIIEGRKVDYKILRKYNVNNNIFEKDFRLNRIAFEYRDRFLFGESKVINNVFFDFDREFKVFLKILKLGEEWRKNRYIDNPKTLSHGKITYRKLFNLLKTFEQLSCAYWTDFKSLNEIKSKFESNYIFKLGAYSVPLDKLEKELRELLEVHFKTILSKLGHSQLNHKIELANTDDVWNLKEIKETELTLERVTKHIYQNCCNLLHF